MYILILITAANKKEASVIAEQLIKNKCAACVNMAEGIDSFFWWQGKIDRAKEVLMFVKSVKSKFGRIVEIVKSLHSYEVPEIIAFDIIDGNSDYLNWIDDSLR